MLWLDWLAKRVRAEVNVWLLVHPEELSMLCCMKLVALLDLIVEKSWRNLTSPDGSTGNCLHGVEFLF